MSKRTPKRCHLFYYHIALYQIKSRYNVFLASFSYFSVLTSQLNHNTNQRSFYYASGFCSSGNEAEHYRIPLCLPHCPSPHVWDSARKTWAFRSLKILWRILSAHICLWAGVIKRLAVLAILTLCSLPTWLGLPQSMVTSGFSRFYPCQPRASSVSEKLI